jgi:hypothetical protein
MGKNGQTETTGSYLLSFGNRPKDTRIPYFRPFYSYLLLLSEDAGLVEIYPWLAELMFYSGAVKENAQQEKEIINLISFFVDDHRFNIANTMLPATAEEVKDQDPFVAYKEFAMKTDNTVAKHPPRHFVVDTFGRFGVDSSEQSETNNGVTVYSLVGAGNPMQMMRTFTNIGDRTDDLGKLNCFVINSISNLCRTMGLRDAMLMIRAMLERAVWKPFEPERSDSLMNRDGMLFAILHKGVFEQEEIQYASTFFDGIIEFEGKFGREKDEGSNGVLRKYIGYSIKSFPGLRDSKESQGGPMPEFNFNSPVWYEPLAGRRMRIVEKILFDGREEAQNE